MEKDIKLEKIVEAIVGIIFLIPPIISVICFVVNLTSDGDHCRLTSLSGQWNRYGDGVSSTVVVYFGLMAIAGAYMLKNSLRYLIQCIRESQESKTEKKESATPQAQQ
jgi:TRAP-type mannitol/chloroaromatic compound transport system permease small subunit